MLYALIHLIKVGKEHQKKKRRRDGQIAKHKLNEMGVLNMK